MYAKYAELRDAIGLRDADVAAATQIPQSTFTDWKNGRSKPKLEKLLKLAKFFGVSVEEFAEKAVEV